MLLTVSSVLTARAAGELRAGANDRADRAARDVAAVLLHGGLQRRFPAIDDPTQRSPAIALIAPGARRLVELTDLGAVALLQLVEHGRGAGDTAAPARVLLEVADVDADLQGGLGLTDDAGLGVEWVDLDVADLLAAVTALAVANARRAEFGLFGRLHVAVEGLYVAVLAALEWRIVRPWVRGLQDITG